VVLVRDDDLVAGLQQAPQGLREDIGILRGRRPELDFVRAGIEPAGEA
jgi:hypothetical protein